MHGAPHAGSWRPQPRNVAGAHHPHGSPRPTGHAARRGATDAAPLQSANQTRVFSTRHYIDAVARGGATAAAADARRDCGSVRAAGAGGGGESAVEWAQHKRAFVWARGH
eukprot:63211-Chlamydomonas_euryale.AAC.4